MTRKIMLQKVGLCALPTFVKILSCTSEQVDWARKPLYIYVIEVDSKHLNERFYHDIYLQNGFLGMKSA